SVMRDGRPRISLRSIRATVQGRQPMRKSITGAIAAGILSISIAAALAQAAPAKTADTSKGKALVDDKGMTLYIFDRDTSGKSNCNGQCATNWPPLQAAADAKASADWTVVSRDD